jgi:hypothetical protein
MVIISYLKSRLPGISTSGLLTLAKDAESRIGSHVSGGNPVPEYVEKQQALLEIIQDELALRRT